MFFVAELEAHQRMLPSGGRKAACKPVGPIRQVEPLLGQLQKPAFVAHARCIFGHANLELSSPDLVKRRNCLLGRQTRRPTNFEENSKGGPASSCRPVIDANLAAQASFPIQNRKVFPRRARIDFNRGCCHRLPQPERSAAAYPSSASAVRRPLSLIFDADFRV